MQKLFLFIVLIIPIAVWSSDSKQQKPTNISNPLNLEKNLFIQNAVEKISPDSVLSYLQVFESFGIKEPGKSGLQASRDWIRDKMQTWGYTGTEFQNFIFNEDTLQNIISTKPGSTPTNVQFIIEGHYDSYQGPGTNDNGSGVAVMLEVARIASPLNFIYNSRFIFFSAEEAGLIGSQAYVNEVVIPHNLNILLVLNVDEVGGVAGLNNATITCERDEGYPPQNNMLSAAYTDTLAALTVLYTDLQTQIAHAWGSDYMSFEAAGYTITGFYESNESPYTHSAEDIITNMDPDYVTEVTRTTLAALMYFARVDTSGAAGMSPGNIKNRVMKQPALILKPNPFNSEMEIEYFLPQAGQVKITIFDLLGREIRVLCDQFHTAGNFKLYFISGGLASGVYYVQMAADKYRPLIQQVVIVK